MWVLIFFSICCLSGFILFKRIVLKSDNSPFISDKKVSVIIPARNEEKNLPFILQSLSKQTYKPYEIIVVDDGSKDRTKEIAHEFNVTVVDNPELPDGWTGKTWAVWNGFLHTTGDILVFLDSDVRLEDHALEALLKTREKNGGTVSVVPYHHTERFYERFSLITNILGIFAFTSPFETKTKGLYGSCIITAREDYEKIGGHSSIKADIIDDLNLGKKYSLAGIKINNYIGYGLVSFRMYPDGFKSEVEGFSKGATLGAASLTPLSLIFVVCYIIGLISSSLGAPFLFVINSPYAVYFLIGYLAYTIQIIYFIKYVGNFGIIMPLLNFLSTLFFLFIILYSAYQVNHLGYVNWKGRHIEVAKK